MSTKTTQRPRYTVFDEIKRSSNHRPTGVWNWYKPGTLYDDEHDSKFVWFPIRILKQAGEWCLTLFELDNGYGLLCWEPATQFLNYSEKRVKELFKEGPVPYYAPVGFDERRIVYLEYFVNWKYNSKNNLTIKN